MPLTCPGGGKPRFRFRRLKGGRKQRLAFCGRRVIEVTNFGKSGRKGKTRKIRRR